MEEVVDATAADNHRQVAQAATVVVAIRPTTIRRRA